MNPRNSDTQFWKILKQIDREDPQIKKGNLIEKRDGQFSQNDREAANEIGEYYQENSKIEFYKDDRKIGKDARKIFHICKNKRSENPLFEEEITLDELNYALTQQDPNKSPGPDGIHGQMLRNLSIYGKEKLLQIYNKSWRENKLPKEWKHSIIIPIHKAGKNEKEPKSYRPVALTCIACKIFERIILQRLMHHVNNQKLLPEEQYGFRPGHTTIDQILYFSQKVKDAQNCKPTKHTIAAFLDLSQAFDKVWRNKLITKIYHASNINGRALAWIYDFFKMRTFKVKYNSEYSKTYKQFQGTPQGSVLSPILFTLYLAGIEKQINEETDIALFADDIILWTQNHNAQEAELHLNNSVTSVNKYASEHKLNFNPAKSEIGFFTTNKKLYNAKPNIYLKNELLKGNKHPKYLGFTLDPEITSNKHIETICNKGRKRLNILKSLAESRCSNA